MKYSAFLRLLLISSLALSLNSFAKEKKATDPKIDDNEIRSEMGSMSRFSLSSRLSYYGGALDDPFGAEQPNPQSYDTSGKTSMSGTFSLRYRINKMSSVTISTGLYLQTPFAHPDKFDLSSPSIGYNFTNKFKKVLGRGYVSLKYYTDEYSHDISDKRFKLSTGYKVKVKNIIFQGLRLGLSFNTAIYSYGHSYRPGVDKYNSTLYYFNVSPSVEYKINRMFTVKTSFTIGRTNYRRFDSKTKYENNLLEQSIGLGTGFTREIYLYTYIKTYPTNYRIDTAIFGMSLNFSVF